MKAILILACVAAGLINSSSAVASGGISEGSSWHLFLDDQYIDSAHDIQKEIVQPKRILEPVLKGDTPWEHNPFLFGSVIHDKETNLFKMWYMSYNPGEKFETLTCVLYAESKDGIVWDKPRLGLYDFKGDKKNNIVLTSLGHGALYSPSVIKDDLEVDPEKRYKMVYWDKKGPNSYGDGGMFIAYSPDGKKWRRPKEEPVLYASRTENSVSDVLDLLRDPISGKYVVYGKGWSMPGQKYRNIIRTESDNFEEWSAPKPVLLHAFDQVDPQSYGMPVFYYSGMYIGLMRSFKLWGDDPSGTEDMDIELTSSRNGVDWQRTYKLNMFLPTGPDGSWDEGMILTAPPIVVGDKIYIYYSGWNGPHNSKKRNSAIGLSVLSDGRFASIRPMKKQGQVITPPIEVTGKHLLVNADAAHGSINVAILKEDGSEIENFTIKDSKELKEDGLSLLVDWNQASSLSGMVGKKVRLKFVLNKGSKLFAFKFSDSSDEK